MHVTLSTKLAKQYQQRTEFYYKVITREAINKVHAEALIETLQSVYHIYICKYS